ncbi:ATP-binding protein [Mucilaginibacter sp. SMC90]|uniref:sensor histidine kinase n=1 Tax=Mucilaginibacter sp. SMC90 TaxID=2929803 RepID=UPI001FB37591|nr:two-component regulator propeller domain-containing protein [Mucilaginibacter sp. SMC90]UOE49033.1 ATP-binding protein [Mucilaginibacter sp. SMC90]
MKKITLLILCCCVSLYAASQSAHLYFDRFDIKKGLPESNVSNIIEDSEGYMWLSTQNGLVRYDGYQYKIYRLGSAKLNRQVATLVFSVAEDNKKNLWVSTLVNGLFRYNRQTDTFEQYPYPENDLYAQFMISTTDNEGNVWGRYNTTDGKQSIVKFHPATGQYEKFSKWHTGIHHIEAAFGYNAYKTANGVIWLATDNGIYRYNGAGKGFTAYFTSTDTARQRGVNPVYEAPSEPGVLYMNTFHGNNVDLRLTRFDTRTGAVQNYKAGKGKDSLLNAGIYSIYEDKAKRLWLGTMQGLSKFDRQKGTFSNYVPDDTLKQIGQQQLSAITETKQGTLWMTSPAGLVYFDPNTAAFTRYSMNPDDPGALASLFISTKTVDHTNTLWIGYGNAGAARLNKLKSAFDIYKTGKKINGYPPKAIAANFQEDGTAWITTRQGFFRGSVISNQYKKMFSLDNAEQYSGGVFMGKDNMLYVGSHDGLIVFNTLTGKKLTYKSNPADSNTLVTNDLNFVFQDHTGIVWIATNNAKGICSFDPASKKFTRYPYRNTLEAITPKNKYYLDDSRPIAFYEDRSGTLWIGTNFGGLSRFDRKNRRFISYFNNDIRNATCVNTICETKSGKLWIGTYLDGIFEFDRRSGKFTRHFNERSGLLFNSVIAMNEDADGRIWMLSERGLSRLNPETMQIKNFAMDNILPGYDILRAVNQLTKLPNGRIVFPLVNGITVFNPQSLNESPYLPVVHIEDVVYSNPSASEKVFNKVLAYGHKTLELPYDQNRVQIDYIGLQYDNPQQNAYAYKLEGYDKNWVNAGTDRWVTYNNLSAGTYVFHVKAANSSGKWNNTGDSITIIIATAWYLRWWAWLIYVVLFAWAIYAFIAYRSRHLKHENLLLEQKVQQRTNDLSLANKELSEQQEEIITQRDQLAEAVDNLQNTQQQLIQAEKLASLGELTAGIAHEIQNPLNFVNNFSEVSIELIEEMETELTNGDTEEAKAIVADVKLNLEKIHHHGKRADAIVKNMLQHSRAGTGSKEPVNINNLTGEYFKLAYNGLRAKDKTFNAALVTNFDDNLPLINIVQQDIGRVLLNLFNNAFYAVHQKQKTAGENYKPEIVVTTSGTQTPKGGGTSVIISVRDNGMGIPDNIKEKIMQPFFTTKPTGQGTGLGLSLSYDIVVKGHAGKIDIDSKEGEYTEFTITLPAG